MTKTTLLLAALLATAPLSAQDTKGARPVNQSTNQPVNQTRAVVVGISDYQNPTIPDLRFADRDAEAFANWLRSPAGGSLPDSNIVLLKNAAATNAQMIVSLDWLIEASQPGDRAYIYFSGHGDVERVTKFNLGYLLGHDSPPAVYGAGAFSLNYLQAIISTLSENGVQVVVITDACRAGKLAGSGINGTQVTSMQLSQQFANEIKILSCQPEEYSLEGEQWGGGRGCFSYHLEDALYGLADNNADAAVDLRELRRYLEDRVSAEAAPQSQIPMVNGPVQVQLAQVNPEALAIRTVNRKKQHTPFMDIENKGIENRLLEKMDTNGQRMYAEFLAAIDSGHLMSPAGRSANDYFIRLLENPQMAALHGTMKRKLAAALIEDGQTALNKLLMTDPTGVDDDYLFRHNEVAFAEYYRRAAEILGPAHYAWHNLKATELGFRHRVTEHIYPDSSAVWRGEQQKKLLDEAIAHDSTIAVLYRWRAFMYFISDKNRGLENMLKAIELAPNWALAHYEVCIFSIPFGIKHLKTAISLAPGMLPSYAALGDLYSIIGESDSAHHFTNIFIERFSPKFAHDSSAVTAFECNAAGLAYNLTGEFEKSKAALLVGRRMSGGYFPIHLNLAVALTELQEFEAATQSFEQCYAQTRAEQYAETIGNICFFYLNDTARAVAAYSRLSGYLTTDQLQAWFSIDKKKAFHLARERLPKPGTFYWPIFAFYTAETALQLGMADTATHYFRQIAAMPFGFNERYPLMPRYLFAAIAAHRLGDVADFDQKLVEINHKLGEKPITQFNLACIYAQISDPANACDALGKAVNLGWKPARFGQLTGTLCDPFFDPIRHTECFRTFVKKHFPKHYDIATGIPGK